MTRRRPCRRARGHADRRHARRSRRSVALLAPPARRSSFVRDVRRERLPRVHRSDCPHRPQRRALRDALRPVERASGTLWCATRRASRWSGWLRWRAPRRPEGRHHARELPSGDRLQHGHPSAARRQACRRPRHSGLFQCPKGSKPEPGKHCDSVAGTRRSAPASSRNIRPCPARARRQSRAEPGLLRDQILELLEIDVVNGRGRLRAGREADPPAHEDHTDPHDERQRRDGPAGGRRSCVPIPRADRASGGQLERQHVDAESTSSAIFARKKAL